MRVELISFARQANVLSDERVLHILFFYAPIVCPYSMTIRAHNFAFVKFFLNLFLTHSTAYHRAYISNLFTSYMIEVKSCWVGIIPTISTTSFQFVSIKKLTLAFPNLFICFSYSGTTIRVYFISFSTLFSLALPTPRVFSILRPG